MAFVDLAVHPSHISAHGALRLANRFAALARSAVHAPPVEEVEDDVFTPSRLKAARLPAIESCQTTIFRELRHREELMTGLVSETHVEAVEAPGHGFSARIAHLFHAH